MAETINADRKIGALSVSSIQRIIVDTTVQEKAVAFPTDSKLLNDIRRRLVKRSAQYGLRLRQNYHRVAKRLLRKISGYAHANPYRRMRVALKKLRIRVGRDIGRQLEHQPDSVKAESTDSLAIAHRLLKQKRRDKSKLYRIHAPETQCISKGKAHKRYEFGVIASFTTTNDSGFVVGARSCPGNPYDGHALAEQLEQVEALTEVKSNPVYVDKGYRGYAIKDAKVMISGQRRLSKI